MPENNQNSLLAQYRECYEYLRQHDRFIWQAPSITVVINGALLASFAYIPENLWWVREIILLIAAITTFSLFIAAKKHRYFSELEQGTLFAIENELQIKHTQRTTFPADNPNSAQYWYEKTPRDWSERRRAVPLLVKSILIMFVLVVIALIMNPMLHFLN